MVKTTAKNSKTKVTAGRKTKSLARTWDQGLDWPAADPQRPNAPYSQSDWVFICVSEIIKAVQSIPMVLSTQSDDIVESGPAFDLLMNNPKMPISRFVSETAGYLALYRECYWVFLDKDVLKPTQILVCGPNQVQPEIRQGVLVGYWLQPEGCTRIPLIPEDVWPILGFNPDSRLSGVGPARAGKLAISTAYQAALLNEATLANGGKLGAVIVYPAGLQLDDDERRSLVSQFEHRHAGARNAGKTAILTGGADVKSGAFSMVDLQMLDLRMFDAKTICALMGVPAAVAGLDTEAQYSNGPAQQRFILNMISPLLAIIAENINLGLMPRFRFVKHSGVKSIDAQTFCGSFRNLKRYRSYKLSATRARQTRVDLFAWFSTEDHPTVAEMIRSKADQVLKLTTSGIPLNQLIDAFDLPFEHVAWGDDFFVPMGMATANQIIEGAKEPLLGPALPEGQPEDPAKPDDENPEEEKPVEEDKPEDPAKSVGADGVRPIDKLSDVQRRLLWRKWASSWAGLERETKSALRGFWARLKRETLDRLQSAMKDVDRASSLDKNIKASADEIVLRVVFDLVKEKKKLKAIHREFYTRGADLGVRQSLSEIQGLSGDALVAATQPFINNPAVQHAIAKGNEGLEKGLREFREAVQTQVREGLSAGEGLPDLTKRLTPMFDGQRTNAQRAARTQTASAVSTGRHEGMRASGVKRKAWITSGDDQVRQAHRDAGRDYADGIPIDQPFIVGGDRLMYPGDPTAPYGNIVNCRCLQVARLNRAASFEFIPYVGARHAVPECHSRAGGNPEKDTQ